MHHYGEGVAFLPQSSLCGEPHGDEPLLRLQFSVLAVCLVVEGSCDSTRLPQLPCLRLQMHQAIAGGVA